MKKYIVIIFLILIAGMNLFAKVFPLPELEKPTKLFVDDRNAYITQNATIYIFSLKDCRLVKKFGKLGEGPQEFKVSGGFPLIINPMKDRILINSVGKISYFTKDGKFISEIRNRIPYNLALWPLGNLFVGRGFRRVDSLSYMTIEVFNRKFQKVREIYSTLIPIQRSRPGSPIKVLDKSFVFETYGEKIFVASKIDMILDVISPQGKKLYTINHPYERIVFTDKVKQDILNFYKKFRGTRAVFERFKKRLVFPQKFPAIQNFFVSNDKINIMTYDEKDEQIGIYVFDLKGKLLKKGKTKIVRQTPLEHFPFWIAYDKMYQIIDNEDEEEWELHINDIK